MSEREHIIPPKWPLRFLRFFVKKEFIEEIEGDIEEIFNDQVEYYGQRKARRMYVWEVMRLLRPVLIKNLEFVHHLTQHAMFKNYFKVSIRNLMKNPLNSSINIIGLSVAIGFCMLVFAFRQWTYSIDQFHEHKSEVFLTTFIADRDGAELQFGKTPRPLGEMMKEDFPQIHKMCRVEDRAVVIKHDDDVFHERVRLTDPEFLEMFTFPLKWGTASSLKDLNSVILSEDMSVKYFGEENPIGETILIKSSASNGKEFKITGVAKEFPKSRTIQFDFLINFQNLQTSEPKYDFHDWTALLNATFIQVNNASDIRIIQQGMNKYKTLQNEAVEEDWAIRSFAFEPLTTLNQRSEYIRDDISRSSGSNRASVIYLSIIGILMLALASFNYINIAIVSATRRLKEIGVRKSIGANRGAVIIQFLSENILITFFALIIGVILGYIFFIPGFEKLWDFKMDFKLNNPTLWIYLPLILLFTGILSGAYPAFYISKFQAVGILKGSVKFGKKNPLTKTFLAIQLVLACLFITGAVMFTQNSSYMAKRSWGYNQHEALYAAVPDQPAYEQLQALMIESPDVVSTSGSVHHLGRINSTAVLHFPDRDYESDLLSVGATYFETMGLQLVNGRLFNDHEGSDRNAVVVNELLVKNMGWSNPIGQQFRMDSLQYEVIGVVKDFHSYSFFKLMNPAIFKLADKSEYRYLTVKVRPESEKKAYQHLQAKWSQLFPETPFDGGYQEDVWGGYFMEMKIHGIVWRVIAFIAISLAALGLYGLVTLNVAGRVKEFSIRKVLGAGVKSIAFNIYKQYALLFTIALIVGAPISYRLIKLVFDTSYEYHMPVDYSGATIAVIILISVLLITISTQIRKVVKTNAVNGLKVE